MVLRIFKDKIIISEKDYEVVAMYDASIPNDIWSEVKLFIQSMSNAKIIEVAGGSDNGTIVIRGAGT